MKKRYPTTVCLLLLLVSFSSAQISEVNFLNRDSTFTGAYSTMGTTSNTKSFVDNSNTYNPLKKSSLSVTELEDVSFETGINSVQYYLFISFRVSEQRTINLFSINGNKVLSKTVNTSEIELDISHLSNGLYFLNIDKENFKIIKL
ncbi:T9SS type A sorting domain-containing protein [Flavivirga rizhaonensis]|uniref:T9SS type A sorting domain-containing protein n=1 Tax=Flavivirga rizhaonensis TaxID=2559571 RepID=A0A4S1DXJ0_9FLAO|nr:T9SS type A sorting domain-containing protein [Flavivirga rizhaonensis]TGV02663.1 T9SS type A sorting domain-containing protein [Flavivirga rizhaonensis]